MEVSPRTVPAADSLAPRMSDDPDRRSGESGASSFGRIVRRSLLPLVIFAATTFAFMPSSLMGRTVSGPFDLNATGSPYRDRPTPVQVANPIQDDVNQAQPWWLSFWRDARHGEYQTWSPAVSGGTPTGTLPLNGSLSPFSWSALVLPAWYAVTVRVALLLFVAQLGTYLLTRRLGLARWPAVLAGVAYGFSGVNIVFLLRIGAAALCPLLLWATHRLCSRVTWPRFVVAALVVAWVWSEGFPAGMVFDLTAAAAIGGWVLLGDAVIAGAPPRERIGRLLGRSAAFGGAVVVGLALMAITVLPFISELGDRGTLDQADRQYGAVNHLSGEALWGLVDVSGTGDPYGGPPFTVVNSQEGVSAVGSISLLGTILCWLAVALGRARLTGRVRRLWGVIVTALLVLILFTFVGTRVLGWLYEVPGFAGNLFHRSRYLIALLSAVFAAVGLDALLRRSEPWTEREALGPVGRWATGGALAVLAGYFVMTLDDFVRIVDAANQGSNVSSGFLRSALFAIAAGALVAVVARAGRRRVGPVPVQAAALGLLVVVLWAQLAPPLRDYVPEVDRALFPHVTAGHRQLARLTDGERYRYAASGSTTFYANGSMLTGGLDLRGLALQDPDYKRLVTLADPQAFSRDPFKAILVAPETDFASPALDHLAVRAFVVSTDEEPIGAKGAELAPITSWRDLPADGQVGSFTVPGPIDGVALAVRGSGACRRGMVTLATTSGGRVIDHTPRPLADVAGAPMWFAITGSSLGSGDNVQLSLRPSTDRCRLSVGAVAGAPGVAAARWSQLGPDSPVRLVATGQGWFYERPTAWPVVSMHTSWNTVAGKRAATAAVADWAAGDPIPVSGGPLGLQQRAGRAEVRSFRLHGGSVEASVRSDDGGLVVVAMNDSRGWVATIDGRPARVVSADGALLAVEAPAGDHKVRFEYRPEPFERGVVISSVTLTGLVLGTAVSVVLKRRRRRAQTEAVATKL